MLGMEKQTTPIPSACLGDKDDTSQKVHVSVASLPAACITAANVHPEPCFKKRWCNDSMIDCLSGRAGGYEVPSKGVVWGGLPKRQRPSRIWDTHEPNSMCPQPVPLAGWVTGVLRVPALASSLCLWRPKSFGNQQCPQDPRHTGWGNKDMLQCYHLHCVLHCNSQTSGAASSNCNHFSSLNFGFQYLKQASLGLAASVVPFGVGWGTPLSWPWRAARAQAPGWKDTHLGKALFCLIFPLLLSV